MGDRLRIAIGVLGNANAVLLFAAPVLTFARIMRKKSTEEFSCIPYIVMLFNCLVFAWYGLPAVSYRWENLTVFTVNGIGVLLESSFILIYFYFASARRKIKVAISVIPVILVFCIISAISVSVIHDHHQRKIFVGSFGAAASTAMFFSPLVAVKKVIKTKSVEFMPFYLSLFSFLSSSTWTTYAVLSHDIFIAIPNIIGFPISILQLAIYFVYSKAGNVKEFNKSNQQKDEDNSKQLQPVTSESTNGMV